MTKDSAFYLRKQRNARREDRRNARIEPHIRRTMGDEAAKVWRRKRDRPRA